MYNLFNYRNIVIKMVNINLILFLLVYTLLSIYTLMEDYYFIVSTFSQLDLEAGSNFLIFWFFSFFRWKVNILILLITSFCITFEIINNKLECYTHVKESCNPIRLLLFSSLVYLSSDIAHTKMDTNIQ